MLEPVFAGLLACDPSAATNHLSDTEEIDNNENNSINSLKTPPRFTPSCLKRINGISSLLHKNLNTVSSGIWRDNFTGLNIAHSVGMPFSKYVNVLAWPSGFDTLTSDRS